MGREAYRSLYGDLTKLKDDSLLKDPASGAGDDDELFQLLLSVSDWVDHYCNRHFYPRTDTLVFDGRGTTQLLVPDLVSATTLKEDSNGDLTFIHGPARSHSRRPQRPGHRPGVHRRFQLVNHRGRR